MSAEEFIDAKDELYQVVLEEVSNSTPDLKELDHWRNNEFPKELLKRFQNDDLKIDKYELTKLMDWKLKKGKFRPTLKKLISQNEEEDVITITKSGFKPLTDAKDTKPSKDKYKKLIKTSMTQLVKLRGVGPATASLLLSVLNEITKLAPPFYSDEAAEYVFEKFGDGEMKLKYSMAEYMKWLDLFYNLNDEFVYDFTELENGIWALKKNRIFKLEPTQKPKKEEAEDSVCEMKDIKDERGSENREDKDVENGSKKLKKRKTEK